MKVIFIPTNTEKTYKIIMDQFVNCSASFTCPFGTRHTVNPSVTTSRIQRRVLAENAFRIALFVASSLLLVSCGIAVTSVFSLCLTILSYKYFFIIGLFLLRRSFFHWYAHSDLAEYLTFFSTVPYIFCKNCLLELHTYLHSAFFFFGFWMLNYFGKSCI